MIPSSSNLRKQYYYTFAVVNGYHYVLEYQRCEHKAIDIAQIT